jgi:hypothetical protein
MEEFTDAFARRIAAFDTVAVTGIKKLKHWPFVQLLLRNGLRQQDDIEADLGAAIGKLRQNRSRTEAHRHCLTSARYGIRRGEPGTELS